MRHSYKNKRLPCSIILISRYWKTRQPLDQGRLWKDCSTPAHAIERDGESVLLGSKPTPAMETAIDTQLWRLFHVSALWISSRTNFQSGRISTFWLVPHFHSSANMMGEQLYWYHGYCHMIYIVDEQAIAICQDIATITGFAGWGRSIKTVWKNDWGTFNGRDRTQYLSSTSSIKVTM